MLEDKIKRFTPQIGEILQHHVSHDPNLVKTSDWYYGFVKAVLQRNGQTVSQTVHQASKQDLISPGFYKTAAKNIIKNALGKNTPILSREPRRYLEIACYRHIIGYRLAKDFGFDATQFDLCDRDLEIGRETALAEGYEDKVERVTGDFHDLPFCDNYFDFSFISASIHHTKTPERIIGEAMRVLTEGGLFYCQREPCERLFCFYQFNANRAVLYTPFEKHIHDQDMMRMISSPYPGARNADLFGRIENDHIPLDLYYETFAKYGEVAEEVVYHDGLLTRIDKIILEQDGLPEAELKRFINDLLKREIDELRPSFTRQDEMLGYSLPSESDIETMATKMAAALKQRPENKKSLAWQRAMAKIFGGSLRFVVRRTGVLRPRSKTKFSRPTTLSGHVRLDDAVYKHSGLGFWTKLLPDIQDSNDETLFSSSFAKKDWMSFDHPNGLRMMQSVSDKVVLNPPMREKSVLVMRYRVHVDKAEPFIKLTVKLGDKEIETVIVAQSEDRVLKLVYDTPGTPVQFHMTNVDGGKIDGASRLRVSILQSIPIDETV